MNEIERRRTFAIISHPDAGKTTLTEKFLLFGGQIQVAGAVKSNKIKKTATSDWMEIEKQRGISVSTSVMEFDYKDYKVNILDTPGHQDFAEDTFRTLTAVDSAIIVIDGAKGVEAQTRKLMTVCRMRKTPVIVFINKMDREGKDPFDLLHASECLGLFFVGEDDVHVVVQQQLHEIEVAFDEVVAGHVHGDGHAFGVGGVDGFFKQGRVGHEVAFHVEDVPAFKEFRHNVVGT